MSSFGWELIRGDQITIDGKKVEILNILPTSQDGDFEALVRDVATESLSYHWLNVDEVYE